MKLSHLPDMALALVFFTALIVAAVVIAPFALIGGAIGAQLRGLNLST